MKKRSILFAILIGGVCLAKAQDGFIEQPDHKVAVAGEWKGTKDTHAAWGTSDVRYAWHSLPDHKSLKQNETLTAWRGERVSTQAVIYSGRETDSLTLQLSPLKNGRHTLLAEASFVRYVKTDSWTTPEGRGAGCGHRPDHTLYDSAMVADIIDPHIKAMALEAMSVRSVWVNCQVPADAVPGSYSGALYVKEGKHVVAKLPIRIEIIQRFLTPPED